MLKKEDRIQNKNQLNEWLKYECAKYPCGAVNRALCVGECAILRKHQRLLRKTEYYLNTGKRLRFYVSKLRLTKLQTRYLIRVPLNCCGKGFRIMHLGSILINSNAVIGRDCSFHVNTAVVAGGNDNRTPEIGNGVILGYGACVLGGVKIADNVVVGANAVVNKDCAEEGVAIAGVPARVISSNGSQTWRKNVRDDK